MNLREFVEKNRIIIQLIYGILLMVLIPILISYNTISIINRYNSSIDYILQKQALSQGQIISNLMKGDLPWKDFIQIKLESLISENQEIKELTVLQPDEENFIVIASTNKEIINEVTDSNFYKFAWVQPENRGLATDSLSLSYTNENDEVFKDVSKDERFWLVAVPMKDASEEKKALLAVKLSSEIVDELTAYNRNSSVFLLIATVFIVILFLLVVVRLWDYALLYRKAKEIDKMKDEFISMASHELRAPVTGIKGYSSMILNGDMGKINSQIENSMHVIMGASERLSALVEDLLDVSRIEQGQISLNIKSQDVGPIIEGSITELLMQAEKKGLKIKFLPHRSDLPYIDVDYNKFKQVAINLISNAIKYTEEGQVEIITQDKFNGEFLEIVFKDTGIGMSNEARKNLFKKFYRVQTEKTKNIEGTGLGLWISKRLVELMKGLVLVDSIEGVGTQITIRLPVSRG